MRTEISYGKAQVSVYRTYATPLRGVTAIPESAYSGASNTLLAMEVEVEVFSDVCLPAYTHGDNTYVVPTDTMKNFILKKALEYGGSTPEGFLHFLGREFLATYPHMEAVRVAGRELPFTPVRVPAEGGAGFAESEVLFSRSRGDYGLASLHIERDGEGTHVTEHRCGRADMQLIKVTGSAFAAFPRDEYTTLPERKDRPLFIYMDVYWKYTGADDLLGEGSPRYVAAEQVRDLCQVVFHRFVSMSIQHLIYEMGTRMLERFPQLAEVSFDAQNRLWDSAFTSEGGGDGPRPTVYTDPRPPYGHLKLTLGRDE